MKQITSLAVVAVLSALGTFLVVTRIRPTAKPRLAEYDSRVQSRYAPWYPGGANFLRDARYSQVQVPQAYEGRSNVGGFVSPQHYQVAPESRGVSFPQSDAFDPGLWTERKKDCSSDIYICGVGYYCCKGVCEKAKKVKIQFLADDMGELYICDWKARETYYYTQPGSYEDWAPCGVDLYLKATNTKYEGGGALAVKTGGKWFGSGTTLPVFSQTNSEGPFQAPANFTELNHIDPYSTFIYKYGAYPIKDKDDPSAGVTNFKFRVC